DPVVLCERHPRAPVDPSALTIESDPKRSKSDSARYGIWVVGWPGLVTVITPAQLHMQIETLSSAGWLSSRSVIAPGTQGVIVAVLTTCIGMAVPPIEDRLQHSAFCQDASYLPRSGSQKAAETTIRQHRTADRQRL